MAARGWRSLQATTLVGAARRALRPGVGAPGGSRPAPGSAAPSPDVVVPWPGRALPPVLSTGPEPEVAAAMRDRALAAGLGGPAATELAERWPALPAVARQQVAAPFPPRAHVRWGTDVAAQSDGTTCGAAVLGMLAAAGDPGLALWLATGEQLAGYVPPELRFVRPDTVARTPADRFAALQRAVRHVTNRLGLLGWPDALGTPPWGAVRAARFGPVRFRGEMVDDGDTSRTGAQLARARGALAAGIPVPLYVQGELGQGLSRAVPRHVVLLTGFAAGGDLRVYEPGRGIVTELPATALCRPAGPVPALGGWSHAAWILLPRS